MKTSVVLPAGWFNSIKAYLFDGSENEFCCYLFCGVVRSPGRIKLTGRSFSLPDKPEDYFISKGAACKPSDYYTDNILWERPKESDLIRQNLSIVDIHSHPFAKGSSVSFSSDDDNWQQESVKQFFELRNFTGFYCFIVMGENCYDGRVWHWDKKKDKAVSRPLSEIVILDYPYKKWQNPSKIRKSALTAAQHAVFDRQIRAFGKEGQEVMAGLTAGIAGVGGIGSIAAESLARLGINNFLLVDYDRAEISNLNRFLGMTRFDAEANVHKTFISAREIKQIRPGANVKRINTPVQAKKAVNQLKVCDFIILGTDNLISRAFINDFCLQYCIPLFSLGTVINLFQKDQEAQAGIQDIFGEYFAMIPGDMTCCLKCAGLIDYRQISYLLSTDDVSSEGKNRGYIDVEDITQPAVRALNGAMTEMVMSEVHNYFCGFKESFDEGFGYDQKKNIIHRRSFLNPVLDTQVNGCFIECRNAGRGFARILVNGEASWRIDLSLDYRTQLDKTELGKEEKSVVENYLYTLQAAIENKRNCTLCCQKGKLGLGENEPMIEYPVPDF